jgi:hypothetical protein
VTVGAVQKDYVVLETEEARLAKAEGVSATRGCDCRRSAKDYVVLETEEARLAKAEGVSATRGCDCRRRAKRLRAGEDWKILLKLVLFSSLLHLSCGHSAFYIHIQPSIFNRSLLLPSTDGSSVPLFSSISFVLLKVFPSFILRV